MKSEEFGSAVLLPLSPTVALVDIGVDGCNEPTGSGTDLCAHVLSYERVDGECRNREDEDCVDRRWTGWEVSVVARI